MEEEGRYRGADIRRRDGRGECGDRIRKNKERKPREFEFVWRQLWETPRCLNS